MGFEKRVPSEFGIILPRETDILWMKQGGGMSPQQRILEGVYIPIGELRYNLGYPEWSPDGPNFEEKLQNMSLSSVPDTEDIPDHIVERDYFYSVEEYFHWIDNSEVYGWVTLWDDLYRFTYGLFDLLDSDPRERWADVEELWDEIDESLSFTYNTIGWSEYEQVYAKEGLGGYPRPEAAIKPIRITGSKKDSRGNVVAEWAEEISDEVVFLMCPNAD